MNTELKREETKMASMKSIGSEKKIKLFLYFTPQWVGGHIEFFWFIYWYFLNQYRIRCGQKIAPNFFCVTKFKSKQMRK